MVSEGKILLEELRSDVFFRDRITEELDSFPDDLMTIPLIELRRSVTWQSLVEQNRIRNLAQEPPEPRCF